MKLFEAIPELRNWILPELNEGIDIEELTPGSRKNVVFKCPNCSNTKRKKIYNTIAHEGEIYRFRGCMKCGYFSGYRSSVHVSDIPNQMKYWDMENNPDPSTITANSKDKYRWKCDICGYRWTASPFNRNQPGKKCPNCQDGKGKLFTLIPDLFDWLPNTTETYSYSPSTDKIVEFICKECGEKFTRSIKASVIKTEDGYMLKACKKCNPIEKQTVHEQFDKKYPELLNLWLEEINGPLSSAKNNYDDNYFWKCPTCGQVFPKSILLMSRAIHIKGHGCSYCSGRQILISESFMCLYPELFEEFSLQNFYNNPKLNQGTLHPNSRIDYLWICRNNPDHIWKTSIKKRIAGENCPYCYGGRKLLIKNVYPELERHYNKELNDEPFSKIKLYNDCYYQWICDKGHNFTYRPRSFAKRKGFYCPICNKIEGSFGALHPEYISEWDYDKNDISPEEISGKNDRIGVWWICPEGHSYQSTPMIYLGYKERGENSCRFCRSKVNSFATLHPDLMNEWIYELNDVNPEFVRASSDDRVYWQCKEDASHKYQLSVKDRVLYKQNGGNPCNICRGTVTVPGINSFDVLYPDLMSEWIWINNYLLADPSKISSSSSIPVWWQCPNDRKHKYTMSVASRLMFQKRHREPCPYCKGRRRKLRHFI